MPRPVPRAADRVRAATAESAARARARWYLRNARSVGRKARVLGRPLMTNTQLYVGNGLVVWSLHRQTHLGGDGRLLIGDRVFLNSGSVLLAFDEITIGDDVAIASEAFVTDSDNHPVGDEPVRHAPVRIEDGAWIATRAIVLPGVTIGRRAVVAAGSLVNRDVPADTLVAGNPARPIRRIEYPDGHRTAWRGR